MTKDEAAKCHRHNIPVYYQGARYIIKGFYVRWESGEFKYSPILLDKNGISSIQCRPDDISIDK